MHDFLKFYNSISYNRGWHLSIVHNNNVDWTISIKSRPRDGFASGTIVFEQDVDMELAFAKAQVKFKKWLSENEGGY